MKPQMLCATVVASLLLAACAAGPQVAAGGDASAAAAPQDKGVVITGSKIPRRDAGSEAVSAADRDDFERARAGANQSSSGNPSGGR